MSSLAPTAVVFVLDGQGIPSTTSPQTIDIACQDAQSPLANLALLACHHVLQEDFASLSPEEQTAAALDVSDFATPESLLRLPLRHSTNAVVANIHLYLIQLLRYIASTSINDVGFAQGATNSTNVLGFSSGMLAAAVIASSKDIPSLISHAVGAFRLGFWLGLRVQQHATRELSGASASDSSWSLVTFGSTRPEVAQAIEMYTTSHPTRSRLHLSAVTHPTCVSIAGRPDSLEFFKSSHLPSTTTTSRYSSIHAPYHRPDLVDVKAAVLRDLRVNKVHFPNHTDLVFSLRSTVTGKVIAHEEDGQSLAEEVLDMILLHPVNFDYVVDAVNAEYSSTARSGPRRLVNIGPGNVLWRSIARTPSGSSFTMVDWSSASQSDRGIPRSPSLPVVKDQAPAREPIAIVGMAVKFPKADGTAALWEVLEKGLNTVTEIPQSRFNVSDYNAAMYGAGRSMKTKYGNFMDDPSVFDNAFFRMSPREARSMDPQQRLLLHVSYHALENAGYVPGATGSFDPDTFAVYVGVATNDYAKNLSRDIDVYYSTGTLQAFLSGKISYTFGFSGPSQVIDTACSSSMVAIYQACRALNNRDCNAAVAGGVNVMSSPDMFIGLDRAHFLSSTGQCKPWDASADGYCRSEGCGMFVLKRLSDAQAENDNILGVIRGIEVNHSANADSITQPHVPTQIDLFKKLLSSTGVEPTSISVAEAHGTGTKAGDPTELQSIRTAFARNRTTANPLYLTSIKANIGHAEAASGAASLAKLLLMLRHRSIPPVISLKQLNPKIKELAADGTCIPTESVEWTVGGSGGRGGRLALLNNFGAAGSNAALILQESASLPRTNESAPEAFVLGFACDSQEALEERRTAYLQALQDDVADVSALSDFTYTATARRQLHSFRLAVSGRSKEELYTSLQRANPVQAEKTPGKLVFVFSGQGGQYIGMGGGLYKTLPSFRRVVDHCRAQLLNWGYGDIVSIVNPPECEDVGEDVQLYQCAVYALECALASTWSSWGLKPDAVAGHSLGEYAALVTAKVLSLDDGLKLVAGRAKLMSEKCVAGETGMLAVKLPPSQLGKHLAEYSGLSIACYNSSEDGVVAGTLDELTKLQVKLKSSGHKCARVNVPYAYHTGAMSAILSDITTLAASVQLSAPQIPVVSDVHGRVVNAGDKSVFDVEYFARHCGEPVKFEQGIHDLRTRPDFDAPCTWIEIGPHPTTLPMLRASPNVGHTVAYLPSLRKNTSDWDVLTQTLASLYCIQSTVSWRNVFAEIAPEARLMDLPAYPFAKTQFWVKYEETPAAVPQIDARPSPLTTRYTLLGASLFLPGPGSSEPAIFDTPIDRFSRLIEGHKVAELGLCPASVYMEMATAGAELVLEHVGRATSGMSTSLSEMTFSNPLVYSKEVKRTVRLTVSIEGPADKQTGSFSISSYVADPSTLQAHCSGTLGISSAARVGDKLALCATMVDRRRLAVMAGAKHAETFHTRMLYEVIFSRIVAYSPTYHSIKTITIDPNGVDAYAVVQLPQGRVSGTFTVNPVFTDTLLHTAGFVINCNVRQNEAFICSQVDKVKVITSLIKNDAQYGVYVNIGFMSDALAIADAYAFELGCPEVTIVAHMKRMRFRRLRLSGFKAMLSAAVSPQPSRPSTPPASHVAKASATQQTSKQKAASLPRLETRSDTKRVTDVMASVLGVKSSELAEDMDLERLGLDSLTSIEALHTFNTTFKASLPENLFSTCKTIRDISSLLAISRGADLPPTPLTARSEATLNEQEALPSPEALPSSSLDQVKDILASVLGVPANDLAVDQDLERLGMDSLMSIEAHHAICTALSVSLPDSLFVTCKTIQDVQRAIDAVCSPPAKPSSAKDKEKSTSSGTDVNPVKLQDGKGSSAPPLFLIHDGSGIAHCYGRLSSLGRTVWAIHNPKFVTGAKWEGGLLEMAEHYAKLITSKLSAGEGCVVGGWSIGGVIGFEVARQLLASNIPVHGLLLIDSPHPSTTTPLSEEVIAAAFANHSNSRAIELTKTSMRHATRALVEYDPSRSPARTFTPERVVMLRSKEAFQVRGIEVSDEFLSERGDSNVTLEGWKKVVGRDIPVLDIPGNHFEPFDPRFVEEVSRRVIDALSLLSQSG